MPGTDSKSIFSMDRWKKGGKQSPHANGGANGQYTPVDRNGDDEKQRGANEEKKPEEVDKSRETWGSGVEFILSTMGYAIGLGNVWRFPYMCYENGGGAFLVPYFIMLFIVCFPIMFMEMGLGQFSSLGCISVWEISPFFKGIGYAMTMVSSYFCFYYIIIMSYSIFYMFASLQSELPWRGCNNTWNTINCFEGIKELNQTANWSNPVSTAMPNASGKVWATEEYWK
ncbi:sodium- and chloride-dependent glycine transporter 1-like [Lytechinus variegatus]|uniref:sodium- and chloride-dependent glycine transporter 1-like n=1 Tax=Lytechinus variegatus TaxID=7654 RepID=UPI001BB0DC04|nr:sodium- and chloride-dependent glycine transporter 1-like [Lytechinus variegatus]